MPVTIHIQQPGKKKLKFTNMEAYLMLHELEEALLPDVTAATEAMKMHKALKDAGVKGYGAFEAMKGKHGIYANIGYCRGVIHMAEKLGKTMEDVMNSENMLTKTGKVKA